MFHRHHLQHRFLGRTVLASAASKPSRCRQSQHLPQLRQIQSATYRRDVCNDSINQRPGNGVLQGCRHPGYTNLEVAEFESHTDAGSQATLASGSAPTLHNRSRTRRNGLGIRVRTYSRALIPVIVRGFVRKREWFGGCHLSSGVVPCRAAPELNFCAKRLDSSRSPPDCTSVQGLRSSNSVSPQELDLCGLDEITSADIAEGLDVEDQNSQTMLHTER
jgi:hypothetical protein